jgi:hypothetical protein
MREVDGKGQVIRQGSRGKAGRRIRHGYTRQSKRGQGVCRQKDVKAGQNETRV